MRLLIITLLISLSFLLKAQELKYKISFANSDIGILTVKQTKVGHSTFIKVTSESEIKFFFTLNIKYNLTCKYTDNTLVSSSVHTYINDKLQHSSVTTKIDDHYKVVKDGEALNINYPINYSEALLFVKIPKHLTSIYSELAAFNKNITQIKDNEYHTINPENGYLSEYIYKNGLLQKAVIHHTLLTVRLTKI